MKNIQLTRAPGNEAYPPLENTTSGMNQNMCQRDWRRPTGILKISRKFRTLKYLLILPDIIGLKSRPRSEQAFFKKSPSPITINSKELPICADFSLSESATAISGNTCPPLPPPNRSILFNYQFSIINFQ